MKKQKQKKSKSSELKNFVQNHAYVNFDSSKTTFDLR